MRLPDFFKILEVVCDTSKIGRDRVLAQEDHSVVYFSEKLNDTRLRYSTFDKSSMRWFKRFVIDNIIYRHRQWRTYSGGE